ncbi:hypothetical protein ACFYMW_07915 [Streptomyces sp. NPDC006692]|uniref:hypothetical protein n=1 Tax=Streptomyces sp. NPDC006692 TaxID=3364758 RepID=UPI0036C20315
MAEWHWECSPDQLLEGLPAEAVTEIARFAQEIAVRESMVFLEGRLTRAWAPA